MWQIVNVVTTGLLFSCVFVNMQHKEIKVPPSFSADEVSKYSSVREPPAQFTYASLQLRHEYVNGHYEWWKELLLSQRDSCHFVIIFLLMLIESQLQLTLANKDYKIYKLI